MRTLVLATVLLLVFAPTVAAGPGPLSPGGPKDVYLPELYACLWNGSYKVLVETPVVRVWHYTCNDPDS
jgi:hypothetical protein